MDQLVIIDITPRVSTRLGVFPGDVPFSQDVLLDFPQGHNLKLSSVRTTVHLGAHVDAPCHYAVGGADIAAADLTRYLGPCEVVWAAVPRGVRVSSEHLPLGWQPRAPRVLFRTGSFPDPDHWNADFCSLEPALVEVLASQGVLLVGIDTPSVDPQDSKALETHGTIARAGLSILEGVVLEKAPAGLYTLIALPLPLEGFDASPVRAVLLPCFRGLWPTAF